MDGKHHLTLILATEINVSNDARNTTNNHALIDITFLLFVSRLSK